MVDGGGDGGADGEPRVAAAGGKVQYSAARPECGHLLEDDLFRRLRPL